MLQYYDVVYVDSHDFLHTLDRYYLLSPNAINKPILIPNTFSWNRLVYADVDVDADINIYVGHELGLGYSYNIKFFISSHTD